MNKFFILLKGDGSRMAKYGITYASLGASLIWIILIQLINIDAIDQYFPLFIFADATIMSILLVGVAIMFEKQENALKSMLVTPINKHHYILSKITSTVLSSLLTLVILGAYGIVFKNLSINYIGIVAAVILVSSIFTCVGILITYKSKDFTTLLMGMMIFIFILAIPTLLQFFNIVTAEWFKVVQYFNPTQSAMTILTATAAGIKDNTEFAISLCYLIVLSGILYYFVSKKFDAYAAKELGGE